MTKWGLEEIFPNREIVPVPAFYQAIGGGGPGCITQQLPKGKIEIIQWK